MHRAFVIQLIRSRRALGLSAKRRRMPRQLPPKLIALEYSKALIAVAVVPAIARVQRFVTEMLYSRYVRRRDRMDADTRDLNALFDDLSDDMFQALAPAVERVAVQFGHRTSDYQRAQLQKQIVASVGVDPFLAEPELGAILTDFAAENVALIKSVPNTLFDAIEKRVVAGVRTGDRWETVAADMVSRFNVAESSARLIARDQVGKLYSAVNEQHQRDLGLTRYIWRTSNDDRVRPEHEEREGEEFTWDTPPEDGNPGEAINCRCYAEPIFDELLGEE